VSSAAKKGKAGEQAAENFLTQKGFQIHGRRVRAREEWEKCLALNAQDVRARAYLDLLEREDSSEETRAQ